MAPLIEGHDLRVRFGASEAVRGIDFNINDAEVLGLVGESGSGKSATALAILGLLGAAASVTGKVIWRGRDLDANLVDLLCQSPSARQVADRVAVMRSGQVVETGTVGDVLVHPRHDYTRSLVAAVPTLRTNRECPLAMIGAKTPARTSH